MKNRKKLIFGMLCVTIILGLMIPTLPAIAAAPAAWSDDFESYGTGAFPSSGGWVLAYSGLGS